MGQWSVFESNELKKSADRPDYINVHDNEQGVRFELVNDNGEKIDVTFKGGVLSYRISDEGRRLKTINYISEKYKDYLQSDTAILVSDKSSFIDWLVEETYDMFSSLPVKHYFIITRNEIADVLSLHPPIIKFLSQTESGR